jgi:hypothetical protein
LCFAAVSHAARRGVLAIVAVCAALVAAYLGARVPVLLGAHVDGYAWHFYAIPARVAEYTLYPWLPPLLEVGPSLGKGAWRLAIAAVCAAATLLAVGRHRWRHAGALVVLYAGLLAPVLILDRSFNQYAYLASAAAIGVAACAWRGTSQRAKAVLAASAFVVCLHGADVALQMREIGAIELRFHAELAAALAQTSAAISIEPARAADGWLLQRFTESVPAYRGVSFAERVFAAGAPSARIDASGRARFTMQPDGALTPAAQGTPPR